MWHEETERLTPSATHLGRRSSRVSIAILLAALVGLTWASSEATCGDHVDLGRILAARERIVAHGPLVWPGWTAAPPVLLRSGEVDCLIEHPEPPDGFDVDGPGVTSRPGHLLPQPAATAWPVNGVWSVAVPAQGELQAFLDTYVGPGVLTLDAGLYERVIVHEAFHAHQMTVLGGPEGVPSFGRSGSEDRPTLQTLEGASGIDAAHRAQGLELMHAVTARTAGEAAAAAARFLDARAAWRAAAPPGTDALEQELEWLEGTARYVDVLLAVYPPAHPGLAADGAWRDLLAQLEDLPAIPTGLRDRYAALGAGQAFVLDRLLPGWKRRALQGGASLEALLQEAVEGGAGVPYGFRTCRSEPSTSAVSAWRLLLAEDEEGWTQGLQDVTSLGGVDGLLFVFPEDVRVPFWMRGATVPLDIAFFDSEGGWLATHSMATCEADPCPVYRPDSPYRYALETTPGRMRLQLDGAALDLRGG